MQVPFADLILWAGVSFVQYFGLSKSGLQTELQIEHSKAGTKGMCKEEIMN